MSKICHFILLTKHARSPQNTRLFVKSQPILVATKCYGFKSSIILSCCTHMYRRSINVNCWDARKLLLYQNTKTNVSFPRTINPSFIIKSFWVSCYLFLLITPISYRRLSLLNWLLFKRYVAIFQHLEWSRWRCILYLV